MTTFFAVVNAIGHLEWAVDHLKAIDHEALEPCAALTLASTIDWLEALAVSLDVDPAETPALTSAAINLPALTGPLEGAL